MSNEGQSEGPTLLYFIYLWSPSGDRNGVTMAYSLRLTDWPRLPWLREGAAPALPGNLMLCICNRQGGVTPD